jgi:hypothetical protein
MAAGQQGDEGLIDHLVLAEDAPADLIAHSSHPTTQGLDLFDERIARHIVPFWSEFPAGDCQGATP